MNFTVVFKSGESQTYTYGLVFIPTICWVDGNGNILFNSKDINYKLGYVNELIKVVEGKDNSFDGTGYFKNIKKEDKSCVIVVNNVGHGDSEILKLLIKDLYNEEFKTQVIYIWQEN